MLDAISFDTSIFRIVVFFSFLSFFFEKFVHNEFLYSNRESSRKRRIQNFFTIED